MKFIDGSIKEISPKLDEMDKLYSIPFDKIISTKWNVDYRDIKAVLKKSEPPAKLDSLTCKLFNYILDSPIDVDKIDYITRDSLHVGVAYGRYFDYMRFLQGVTINEEEAGKIVLLEKAKVPVEMLLMIRYAMYKDVYRHHTVRVAEAMLNHAVYLYYKEILKETKDEKIKEITDRIFLLSDDQLLEWLHNTGPLGTKKIVDNIRNRNLYKRLVVFRKNDEKHPDIFENISQIRWKESVDRHEFRELCDIIRRKIEKKYNISIDETDLVIDVPDPDKDKIQDVLLIPEYKEKPVSLMSQSDIFKMIKDNFQKWVHKIRIFIDGDARDVIYKKENIPNKNQPDFEKINDLIEDAISCVK